MPGLMTSSGPSKCLNSWSRDSPKIDGRVWAAVPLMIMQLDPQTWTKMFNKRISMEGSTSQTEILDQKDNFEFCFVGFWFLFIYIRRVYGEPEL